MTQALCLMVTVPDDATARRMARDLVERRLVACAQILSGLLSFYRWQGTIHEEGECLLLMKTMPDRLEALRLRLLEVHPYELPQIVAIPLTWGHAPYLEWLVEETRFPGETKSGEGE